LTEQALRKAKKQEAKAAKVAKAQQKATDGDEAPSKEAKQAKKPQAPAAVEELPKKKTHLQFLKDTLGGASETPQPVQVPTLLSPEPKLQPSHSET